MLTALCSTTSSTRTLRISSSSWARSSSSLGCSPPVGGGAPCCCCSSSATDCSLRCVGPSGLLDRATIDLLDGGAVCELGVCALRTVPVGQIDIDTEGLPRRGSPLDQVLQHLACRDDPPVSEIDHLAVHADRKSTRLNSSHMSISYA